MQELYTTLYDLNAEIDFLREAQAEDSQDRWDVYEEAISSIEYDIKHIKEQIENYGGEI
ncbi:MAG: hypothetical protein GY707_05590 [Desulfobacteraceae bacterium]|nr:hypothetical protein [Desulfobacteraceae bacterium]